MLKDLIVGAKLSDGLTGGEDKDLKDVLQTCACCISTTNTLSKVTCRNTSPLEYILILPLHILVKRQEEEVASSKLRN